MTKITQFRYNFRLSVDIQRQRQERHDLFDEISVAAGDIQNTFQKAAF